MAEAVQKIMLSSSRDIPFHKLVLAQSNVRRIKAGISIEDLAEDIARRSLLQSINVRSGLDAEGQETGMFEVSADGRRYRAFELLIKQKRLANIALVPSILDAEIRIELWGMHFRMVVSAPVPHGSWVILGVGKH